MAVDSLPWLLASAAAAAAALATAHAVALLLLLLLLLVGLWVQGFAPAMCPPSS
jgi:hypothetical protein